MMWTYEYTDRLRKLWGDGCSAGQIAAELGAGLTRNAVIGKVSRMGLCRNIDRTRPARDTSCAKNKTFFIPRGRNHRADLLTTELDDLPPEKPLHGVTLLELTNETCRWPCGHPGEPDFLYCGNHALSGFPYCAGHARMAYLSLSRRRH